MNTMSKTAKIITGAMSLFVFIALIVVGKIYFNESSQAIIKKEPVMIICQEKYGELQIAKITTSSNTDDPRELKPDFFAGFEIKLKQPIYCNSKEVNKLLMKCRYSKAVEELIIAASHENVNYLMEISQLIASDDGQTVYVDGLIRVRKQ